MKKIVGKLILIFGVCVLLSSTSSCTDSPIKEDGTPNRKFSAATDEMHKIAIKAFQNLELDVFKKGKGYIEGGRKCGIARGSEIVGIFIESIGKDKVLVSIDNRKQGCGEIYAVDWTKQLFDQIEMELKK